MSQPDVGTRWRKKPPGREVVEVRRRWMYGYPDAEDTVRAHPINGGRPLVAPVSWLIENYEPAPSLPGEQPGGEER